MCSPSRTRGTRILGSRPGIDAATVGLTKEGRPCPESTRSPSSPASRPRPCRARSAATATSPSPRACACTKPPSSSATSSRRTRPGSRPGRTKNVGVVIPFLNRWFFGAVLEGAEHALLSHGYDLTLYNLSGGGDERRSVFDHFLLRKRVDAVIAISLELTDDELSRLLELNKPVVGVGGPLPGIRTLSIDDVAIARLATEHLISLGHTSIAHIGGNVYYEMDFHLPTNRRVGYEDALRAAGIEPDPELFAGSDFSLQGGYMAAKQLLGRPRNKPDRDLRGVRRDGDRRDPRRARPRTHRAARPVGDRHRRPRTRRVLRTHHHRAVPGAAGADGRRHPHGRAEPRSPRAGREQHPAALRAHRAIEHGAAAPSRTSESRPRGHRGRRTAFAAFATAMAYDVAELYVAIACAPRWRGRQSPSAARTGRARR